MSVAHISLLAWALSGIAAVAEDAVVELDSSNFLQILHDNERVLVEFYAPWCGHCKSLEPEYQKAAEKINEQGLKTVLGKMDATQEKSIAEKYKVEGFPTIHYFVKNQLVKDEGAKAGRDANSIVNFVRGRELPALTEIPEDGLEKFLETVGDDGYAFVAKVARKSARAKTFATVVENSLGPLVENSIASIVTVTFGIIYLPKGTDPKANSTLAMFRPSFEEPDRQVLPFEGKWTDGKIVEFAKSALYPKVGKTLLGELYNAPSLDKTDHDGVVVIALPELDDDKKKEFFKDLAGLSTSEPKWAFTTVVRTGDQPAGDLHSIVISKGKNKYVQKLDSEPATSKDVKAFLDTVKAGKVKRHLRSAEEPAEPVDEHGVMTLVGKTFEQYALDAKKDVFVEFYAPWCGHCKKLTPFWQDLAKRSKAQGWAQRGVIIAKMESTENECDEEVDGFPKLVLYPAVKTAKKFQKKQIYSGARELEPMADFLMEQAKNLDGVEEASSGEKKAYNQVQRDLEKKKKQKTEL